MTPAKSPLLEPIWYAIGALVFVPFLALSIAGLALVLLITWPILPFIMYRSRAAEIAKLKKVL